MHINNSIGHLLDVFLPLFKRLTLVSNVGDLEKAGEEEIQLYQKDKILQYPSSTQSEVKKSAKKGDSTTQAPLAGGLEISLNCNTLI
jgi:hypothetical protein